MLDDKFYACWKDSKGPVKCSSSCIPFQEAEEFLREKRMKSGTITTLESCRMRPQIFYGQCAAVLRAAQRINSIDPQLQP